MLPRFFQIALLGIGLFAATNARAEAEKAQTEKPEDRTFSLRSATAEGGVGSSKSAASLPASTFFYQRVASRASLGAHLELNAGLTMNEDLAAKPSSPGAFATSADQTYYGTAGATIAASDHVDLGIQGNGSPSSSRDVASVVSHKGNESNALLRVDSHSVGATASLAYDSADEEIRTVDVGLDASVGIATYSADSHVAQTPVYRGATPASAFPETHAALMQTRIAGGATFTILDDTDVGASAAYYIYDAKNPAAIGTFEASTGYGVGAPILPLRWSVSPAVGRRVGPVSMRAYYEFADLAAPGVSHTLGGRVQVTVSKSIRLYALSSYRAMPAPGLETTHTWSVGLGINARFD